MFEFKVTVHYGLWAKWTHLWPLHRYDILAISKSKDRGITYGLYPAQKPKMRCSTSKVGTLQVKSILSFVFDVLELFLALKWHLIYYNWLRHSNFTFAKGSQIIFVFFVIFWMFSSTSKKVCSRLNPLSWCATSQINWHLIQVTWKVWLIWHVWAKRRNRACPMILCWKSMSPTLNHSTPILLYVVSFKACNLYAYNKLGKQRSLHVVKRKISFERSEWALFIKVPLFTNDPCYIGARLFWRCQKVMGTS